MREIVIDTETTGLDPSSGHRVVEIGAVELLDHAPTGSEAVWLDYFTIQGAAAWERGRRGGPRRPELKCV